MKASIEEVIPGFHTKCALIHSVPIFDFSWHEAEVIVMMMHDYDPKAIASLFSRSAKTIYKHCENSLRKTDCKTYFAMAYKIRKFVPDI